MISLTLGGIGIFLLGMILMTDGLKTAAGDSLRQILARATGGPLKGAITGAGVTALVQSSSATTVTTIGFVSAGLLSFPQAVGVILGANLGTTSTGWIVGLLGFKLKISVIALPLVGVGALMKLLTRGSWSAAGRAVAGFGLIFVGIDLLQDGMQGLAEHFDPASFPGATLQGRLLLVLIGIIMTVVMQSSSAAMATALTALHTQAISFDQAAALVIGQNIGTTVTAAIATIGASTAARRTAIAHIIFNVVLGIGAFVLFRQLVTLAELIGSMMEPAPGALSLATFHTLVKLSGIVVFLPLAAQYAAAITRLLPDRGSPLTRHLDPSVAHLGPVAIEAARRAVIGIADVVIGMVVRRIQHVRDPQLRVAMDDVDRALQETRTFLSRVQSEPNTRTFDRHLGTLHAIDHLDRLSEAVRESQHARVLDRSQELRMLAENMLDELAATRGWLHDPSTESPLQDVETMSTEIVRQRRDERPRILQRAAAGAISPEEATRQLEAMRWIDRLAYHTWRSLAHLQELAADTDVPSSGTFPESSPEVRTSGSDRPEPDEAPEKT